jgi:2-dehydro-3-deoxyphosphogluconate aldolase/(4S)-4-hydroxy-2-oxoglutarate aldolase
MIDLRQGDFAASVRRNRLVAILRRVEPRAALLALVDDVADAGVRIIEITFDAPTAAEDIAAIRSHLEQRVDGPFVVGAGTLMRREQLDAAIASGAQFGVSPVLQLDLLEAALANDLPFIPTGMTTTEVWTAWSAGSTFVKLFPASAVGPQFVRDIRGPLPEIEIIPSGGVDRSNAQAFLDAGAVAVGLSSAITRGTAEARRSLIDSLIGARDDG